LTMKLLRDMPFSLIAFLIIRFIALFSLALPLVSHR